jgi:hypothetical protein
MCPPSIRYWLWRSGAGQRRQSPDGKFLLISDTGLALDKDVKDNFKVML